MSAPEVFRGHFDECLRHYSARTQEHVPKGSTLASKVRRPIATFCGVIPKTVKAWFSGTVPNGTRALKAMCFLDSIGYRIIELESMSETRRHLAELIGYDMMSLKDVASVLGIASEDDLLSALRTNRSMHDGREEKIWELFKTHKDALAAKKQSHVAQPRKKVPAINSTARKVVLPAVAPALEPVKASNAEDIRKSFVAMQLLLLLLEGGVTDALADPKRKFEAAERRVILQLSMILNRLSSQILLRESSKEVGDGKS